MAATATFLEDVRTAFKYVDVALDFVWWCVVRGVCACAAGGNSFVVVLSLCLLLFSAVFNIILTLLQQTDPQNAARSPRMGKLLVQLEFS